jgi:hypothetical protein
MSIEKRYKDKKGARRNGSFFKGLLSVFFIGALSLAVPTKALQMFISIVMAHPGFQWVRADRFGQQAQAALFIIARQARL